jgi:hypothetical protein
MEETGSRTSDGQEGLEIWYLSFATDIYLQFPTVYTSLGRLPHAPGRDEAGAEYHSIMIIETSAKLTQGVFAILPSDDGGYLTL